MSQRALSPKAEALLGQLRGPARSLKQVLRIGDSPASILDELGAGGEPLTLSHVLPYVFDRRRSVSRAAARAAASILGRVPATEVPWLDERLRARSTWGPGWFDMSPSDLRFLKRFGSDAWALQCLATCHPSGYVREAALRALAPIRDGSELPFVLVRLNDWVGPVRELAARLMRERANPDYVHHLLAAVPLVMRLQSLRREDHAQTVSSILGVLRLPEAREALLQGTKAADRQVRRAAFEIVTAGDAPFLEDLFNAAVADDDPLIRLWAAKRLAPLVPDEELDTALAALEHDPFMAVRREALELRLARRPASAEAKLVAFLLDRSAAVRSFSQYQLRTRFRHDPAVDYREAIRAREPRLSQALAGLGEVGEPNDSGRVEPFLFDVRARVRATAIRALDRLSKEPRIPSMLRALEDESPAVSRAACAALQRAASRVPAAGLRATYEGARRRHVRRNALAVLARVNLWDGVPTLVAASADTQDELRGMGRALLDRWLVRSTRSWVVPTGEQLQQIRDALTAHGASMDLKQRDQLRYILRTVSQ